MTPAEVIAFGQARHGDEWKGKLADETGWSWWAFNRISKGGEVSPKLAKALKNLPKKGAKT
ncbi:hypothetical protein [Paludisphaera sp.]|uniref:hypothetical protein n=1 Tax=Paludisphaera sp. TaxID=2017432 RepID=UPI00301D2CB9